MIKTKLTYPSEPYWTPLEEALGAAGADGWMYMGAAVSNDGLVIHLYKHHITRQYINLSADGRAWRYGGDGYEESPRLEAIKGAWETLRLANVWSPLVKEAQS